MLIQLSLAQRMIRRRNERVACYNAALERASARLDVGHMLGVVREFIWFFYVSRLIPLLWKVETHSDYAFLYLFLIRNDSLSGIKLKFVVCTMCDLFIESTPRATDILFSNEFHSVDASDASVCSVRTRIYRLPKRRRRAGHAEDIENFFIFSTCFTRESWEEEPET